MWTWIEVEAAGIYRDSRVGVRLATARSLIARQRRHALVVGIALAPFLPQAVPRYVAMAEPLNALSRTSGLVTLLGRLAGASRVPQADRLPEAIAKALNTLGRSLVLAAIQCRFAQFPRLRSKVAFRALGKSRDLLLDEAPSAAKKPAPAAGVVLHEPNFVPDDCPIR